MVIYAEWIFVLNFASSFLCISLVSAYFGISFAKRVAAAAISGLWAVISFSVGLMPVFMSGYAAISAFLFRKNLKGHIMFFITVICMYSLTVLLMSATKNNIGLHIYNGILYCNISEKVFITAFLIAVPVVYMCERVWRSLLKKTVYKIRIIKNNKEIITNALYDSGNLLTEYSTGKNVILVDKSLLRELDVENILLNEKPLVIPYKSFDSNGVIFGFSADEIIVNNKKIDNAVIGISENSFADNCGALIGGI